MTGTEIIIVGGVAVGAAFVTEEAIPDTSVMPSDTARGSVPTGGSTLGDIVGAATSGFPVASKPVVKIQFAGTAGHSVSQVVASQAGALKAAVSDSASGNLFNKLSGAPSITGNGTNGNGDDPALQAKSDLAIGYCEQAFDKLDQLAKIEAAKKLNEWLDLSPPLNGSEDFQTVVDRCASGAVEMGAKAAANAVVGGVLGNILGAMVGAYLGAKLADFINDSWDDCKGFFEARWGNLSDAINTATGTLEAGVQDVGDAATSVYNHTLGALL